MQARPVQAVDERGELRSRQPHHAIADRRPEKRALLEPLPIQNQPRSIPGQNLQTVRSLRTKDENRPGERVALKFLPRQRRETVGADPEVHGLRRHKHPDARRKCDHVAALTARSTLVSVARSIPGPTRTIAAPTTISIVPVPLIGRTGAGAAFNLAASTITGAKVTPFAAPLCRRASRCRASRRQPNNCCGAHGAERQPRPRPRSHSSRREPHLMLRRPRPPSPRSCENLKPTNRSGRFVQKLSVRHVSNPIDQPRQTIADPPAPLKVQSKRRLPFKKQ